jgi:2-amino-4-hydroxy-6-hydroxymethyldihydropteridine diphosphokinase
MKHTVFLASGSNLGDRAANLAEALRRLPPEVDVLAASPVYETPPWGYTDQPAFLNQAVKAETDLPPAELLAYLKNVERLIGRQVSFKYGPRLIDLDILFYDQSVVETPALRVPHPHLAERAFVLLPLADLAPGLIHPVLGKTVQQLLERVDSSGIQPYSP